MDADFKVPKIPTIFVEQENRSRRGIRENGPRKKTIDESKNKVLEQGENTKTNNEVNINSLSEQPAPLAMPKLELCAACSRVLLAYFKPLHMHITGIIKLAEAQSTPEQKQVESAPPNVVVGLEDTKRQFSQGNYEYRDRKETTPEAQKLATNTHQQPEKGYSSDPNAGPGQVQTPNNHETFSSKSGVQHVESLETIIQNLSVSGTKSDGKERSKSVTNNTKEETMKENKIFENKEKLVIERNVGAEKHEPVDYGSPIKSEISQRSEAIQSDNADYDTVQRDNLRDVLHETPQIDFNTFSSRENEIEVRNSEDSSAQFQEKAANVNLKSPYAVVTIANSNLMAANAIVLVNSFHLTNNNVVIDSKGGSKIFIPFVIILGGSIDPVLKRAINMIFDEVIYDSTDLRLTLLNDKTFGMKLYKLQLWKALEKYEKCLFLESSTIVVGHITNLLFDCPELSAAVDYLFPDYFNCSVFIFSPNMKTYEDLVKFSSSMQTSTNKENPDNHDVVDEMTLLNTFFANNWNKISFIYNYVQNDSIYSQIPAFLRFGKGVKIVNFGYMGTGLSTAQSSMVNAQPWHIAFDLLTTSQSDEVFTVTQINNFTKFYLLIFMKRLWPLLRNEMNSLLPPPSFGRRNWTVFDLMQLMSSKSGFEIEDHMFTQNQITFRRRKSQSNETPVTTPTITETTPLKKEDENQGEERVAEKVGDDVIEKEVESNVVENESLKEQEETLVAEDAGSQKAAWESGRVDWMGVHRSDTIIERLKGKIDKSN